MRQAGPRYHWNIKCWMWVQDENKWHGDGSQDEANLSRLHTAVAPPRHQTQSALSSSAPRSGRRRQRDVFVQHHRGLQVEEQQRGTNLQCHVLGKVNWINLFLLFLFILVADRWWRGLWQKHHSTKPDAYFMAGVINNVIELNEKRGARVFSRHCGELNTCSSDRAREEEEEALGWKKKMWCGIQVDGKTIIR